MRPTLRNALFLSLALSPGLFACASTSSRPPLVTRTRYLMGTMCEISAEADLAQLDAAFGEIERVERLLSTWGESSALSRLNAAPAGVPQRVDPELFELLTVTLDWAKRTDGAFNPLVGELISSWDLRGAGRLPDAATIEAGRAGAGLANVVIDSATHTITRLSRSTRFEEGAFGKGYAMDRAISVLRKSGASSITIDFGGQIAVAARLDGTHDPDDDVRLFPSGRDQRNLPESVRDRPLGHLRRIRAELRDSSLHEAGRVKREEGRGK